jgi:hypothetical protein
MLANIDGSIWAKCIQKLMQRNEVNDAKTLLLTSGVIEKLDDESLQLVFFDVVV